MLAFSVFSDAHFHIVPYAAKTPSSGRFVRQGARYAACTCAHDPEEFAAQERLIAARSADGVRLYSAFGIHPQLPAVRNADFLERLLAENRIRAVGEAGIDLFTEEFRAARAVQEEAWNIQLELAAEYGRPLVVHCRKAVDVMFRDFRRLKKIPAVLFHSFCGGTNEARALLSRGVNAYFSFGKQLLNGNRRAVSCAASLPPDRLLLETDAPFQTLRNEAFTDTGDIERVYEAAYALRRDGSAACAGKEEFAALIFRNFTAVFGG